MYRVCAQEIIMINEENIHFIRKKMNYFWLMLDDVKSHLAVCFRRYTKFYGTSGKAAQTLAHDALTS